MLEWLDIARNQAEERFRSLPLPTANDENYRFTPTELPGASPSAGGAGGAISAEATMLDEQESGLLTISGEEANFQGAAPGVMFTDLYKAAVLGLDFVRQRLKDSQPFADDKFAQLTAARWKNGVFLHVPAGVKVAEPLRAAIASPCGEGHFRHLITVEDGAEVTIIQEHISEEETAFVSELLELKLGREAKVHWVIAQRLGTGTRGVFRQRIELGEGAELKVTPLHLGGASVQVRQEYAMGAESSLELAGAARGERTQHFDFWVDVKHHGSRSRSQLDMAFVMGGNAKAVFNGLLHVEKQAFDCSATQKSRSLLLGGKATVHSIPKLIIQTDQVKCGHGASISTVSSEQLHYLQSRGIPRMEAERMIVRGFTENVLERLPTDSLQGRADAALDRKEGSWLQ